MRYTGIGLNSLIPFIVAIGYPIYWVLTKSPYEGAQTSLHCAVDENIPDHCGKYFRFVIKTQNGFFFLH